MSATKPLGWFRRGNALLIPAIVFGILGIAEAVSAQLNVEVGMAVPFAENILVGNGAIKPGPMSAVPTFVKYKGLLEWPTFSVRAEHDASLCNVACINGRESSLHSINWIDHPCGDFAGDLRFWRIRCWDDICRCSVTKLQMRFDPSYYGRGRSEILERETNGGSVYSGCGRSCGVKAASLVTIGLDKEIGAAGVGRFLSGLGLPSDLSQLALHQISLPSGNARINNNSNYTGEGDPKHPLVFGPLAALGGIIVLWFGWRNLWNCTGWWPDDRRNIAVGLPLSVVGACLIFWAVSHVLTSISSRSEMSSSGIPFHLSRPG
jgi:hypothetical protein